MEKLIKQWNADPKGEIVIKVYQESGIIAAIRGIFQQPQTVDVPSGVVSHLYEPVPFTVKANQRIEIVQEGEIIA